MNEFQKFIAMSRYARWMPDKGRRETWEETVTRWWSWLQAKFPALEDRQDIFEAVLNLEVMPSMRSLMTAGEAADRDNTCTFNCSYVEMDSIKSFSELMFILMCGTGIGFSVERRAVDKLPVVPDEIRKNFDACVTVEDSKEGWANGLFHLLEHLWNGIHPKWELCNIREAGARLNTFGGRASGPAPLDEVYRFVVNTFYKAQGRKLSPIEVHDICCVIAKSIIVGGVRRSAMISLSDLNDRDMALAKSGAWWDSGGHRALANNSASYDSKPSLGQFLSEWSALYDSHSGERGIFNRQGASNRMASQDRACEGVGTNPCGEILLKPMQFCNLTEVIIRPDDKVGDIKRKVEIATIIGTCQSDLTDFPYLRDEWKNNSEDDRLLGVSMTGIFDNPITWGRAGLGKLAYRLEKWRDHAVKTNLDWSSKININPSKAITTVKPSGTVSCLADTSSGIHPRFSNFFKRRVRIDKKDPMYTLMKKEGISCEDCVVNPTSTSVFTFPMKAPKNALVSEDVTPLQHLELWRVYKEHWADHNVSITVNYTDDTFLDIGQWVWDKWETIQGLSFLPKTDHVYNQAPFETITEDEYKELENTIPNVDWSLLKEHEDNTKSTQTLACTGSACEIVDITEEVLNGN